MPDARNHPFYAVCRRGSGSGRSLRILTEHGTLKKAQDARKDDKLNSTGTTAIYKFTWGEKPEFIEGTNLFPPVTA